jgi:NADH-quinone oxidoreductase subunit A
VPILALGAIGFGFAAISVVAGALTGPARYNRAKADAYECGIEPSPQAAEGGRFPVKYFLTAMLFIIFDIEIVFLYPWAVSFDALGFWFGRNGNLYRNCFRRICICMAPWWIGMGLINGS